MARPGLQFGNRSFLGFGLLLVMTQLYYPGVLIAVRLGQTAAWLLGLIAALLATLLVWPVAAALRRIPKGTLYDLAERAVGRWGAIAYILVLVPALSLVGSIVLRQTAEMALTANYPHTPQTFAVVTLLVSSLLAAWIDSAAMVRAANILLVPLNISFALILAGTIGWGTTGFLTPLWGPGLPKLVVSAPAVSSLFAPLAVLYAMADGVTDRRGLVGSLLGVPVLGGLQYALHKANLLMVFSYPLGLNTTFPMHQAARLVIGGRFFEHIEGIWLFVWVTCTIAFMGALLHGSGRIFCRAFGIPRFQITLPLLTVIVLTLAYFPRNQAQAVMLSEVIAVPLMLFALVAPAIFAAIAGLRGRLS